MKLFVAIALALSVFAAEARDVNDKKYTSLPAPTPSVELFELTKKLGGFEEMCAQSFHKCEQPMILISREHDDYAYGVYNPFVKADTIVMSMTNLVPGTIGWNMVLVHEYTHYLQWLKGTYAPSMPLCTGMAKIEIEAYEVSSKYLETLGINDDMEAKKSMMRMNEAMCIDGGYGS